MYCSANRISSTATTIHGHGLRAKRFTGLSRRRDCCSPAPAEEHWNSENDDGTRHLQCPLSPAALHRPTPRARFHLWGRRSATVTGFRRACATSCLSRRACSTCARPHRALVPRTRLLARPSSAVDVRCERPDVAQVAVLLPVVEAVADHEVVGDVPPDVLHVQLLLSRVGLAEQGADLDAGGGAARQVGGHPALGEAGLDD